MKPPVSWSMWWSGLFGMLTIGHVARLATGAVVTVGQTTIPLWGSQVIAPIAAVLSVGLLVRAYRTARCCHALVSEQRTGSGRQRTADLESLSCSLRESRRDVGGDATD